MVRGVLGVEREGDQRRDVGAAVGGAARHEARGRVEVDRARLAVVLRGEVWEDGRQWLPLAVGGDYDGGVAAGCAGRSRWGVDDAGCVGVGVCRRGATGDQWGGIGEGAEAEDGGSEDVGGGAGHFYFDVVVGCWFI